MWWRIGGQWQAWTGLSDKFCGFALCPQVSDAFISSFFEMAVIPMVGNDYEVRPHHHLFVYGVLHRYVRIEWCCGVR